jgi:hypothetical protein
MHDLRFKHLFSRSVFQDPSFDLINLDPIQVYFDDTQVEGIVDAVEKSVIIFNEPVSLVFCSMAEARIPDTLNAANMKSLRV